MIHNLDSNGSDFDMHPDVVRIRIGYEVYWYSIKLDYKVWLIKKRILCVPNIYHEVDSDGAWNTP